MRLAASLPLAAGSLLGCPTEGAAHRLAGAGAGRGRGRGRKGPPLFLGSVFSSRLGGAGVLGWQPPGGQHWLAGWVGACPGRASCRGGSSPGQRVGVPGALRVGAGAWPVGEITAGRGCLLTQLGPRAPGGGWALTLLAQPRCPATCGARWLSSLWAGPAPSARFSTRGRGRGLWALGAVPRVPRAGCCGVLPVAVRGWQARSVTPCPGPTWGVRPPAGLCPLPRGWGSSGEGPQTPGGTLGSRDCSLPWEPIRGGAVGEAARMLSCRALEPIAQQKAGIWGWPLLGAAELVGSWLGSDFAHRPPREAGRTGWSSPASLCCVPASPTAPIPLREPEAPRWLSEQLSAWLGPREQVLCWERGGDR